MFIFFVNVMSRHVIQMNLQDNYLQIISNTSIIIK